MAKYTFVKSYKVYYTGSVEADSLEEAKEAALDSDGDDLELCGESEWWIVEITKAEN